MSNRQKQLIDFFELFVAEPMNSLGPDDLPDGDPPFPTLGSHLKTGPTHPRNISDVCDAIEQFERCLEWLEKCLDL